MRLWQKSALATIGITLSFGAIEVNTSQPASAITLYTITDLGTLGGDYSQVGGLNDLGQVVGESRTSKGIFHAFRTAANQPINPATDDLGVFVNGLTFAAAINNSGQVVGTDREDFAYRLAPNSLLNPVTDDLGTLGGSYSEGFGINNLGQVVGESLTSSGVYDAYRTAANQPIAPVTDDLGGLSNGSDASGINNLGQVVGTSSTANGPPHAYRTAPNSPINPTTDDLGTLGGLYSYGYGINDLGQVVGAGFTTDNAAEHAFRTAPNSPINPATDDLGTLGGHNSYASSINNIGQVVGASDTPNISNGLSVMHAFIYDSGTMYDLNDLISPALAGIFSSLTESRGINSSGQIVGNGISANGQEHAFLATPVTSTSIPESGNGVVSILTILGLGLLLKRKS